MFTALLVIHIILCLGLIGFVLLQQGKGADAGATFGGSNAGSVLGTGGADFATKLTTGLAFAFMITSVLLVRAYQTAELEQLPIAESPQMEGSAIGSLLEQEAKANEEAVTETEAAAVAPIAKDAEEKAVEVPAVEAAVADKAPEKEK